MNEQSSAGELLDTLMRNLKEIISTKTIIGDPIQAGTMTILPLMKVSLGFGAGAGGGNNTAKSGSGGGGGGGVMVTPVGFLIVQDGHATVVTPQNSKWDWIAESIPDIIERVAKFRREGKEQKSGESASA
jgi:uncharacterized spore protein YtfJ